MYYDQLAECDSPSCTICPGSQSGEKHMVWRQVEDLSCSSVFPYAPAAVCTRWSDVMATVPEFWARLVYFVDTDPSDVEVHLAQSRQLPLQVSVMRRSYTVPIRDALERKRVGMVMDDLVPHLPRCEKLSFDLLYSSSLPSVCRDFMGEAPLLTSLTLECKIDDGNHSNGVSFYSPSSEHLNLKTFLSPVLTELIIDGRNFMEICQNGESYGWLDIFERLSRLTILRLSNTVGKSDLRMDAALNMLKLQMMPSLFFLRLVDVHFSQCFISTQDRYELNPTVVEIEDLNANDIELFLRHSNLINLDAVYLTRTAVGNKIPPIPDCWSVTLEDMDCGEALAEAFITWSGGSLDFINSPGFTDFFLLMMSINWSHFGCRNVQELHIVDCTNFTVAALKHMVEIRNKELGNRQATVEDNDNPPVIVELNVTGRGPVLSPEDAEWFKVKVALFHWDTVQP